MPVPPPSATVRAVVTGASSGIGRELARALAARGHSVILVARRGDLLEELAGELRTAHEVSVEVRAVDLSDPTKVEVLAAEFAGREISILCNNAGIATFGPGADLDADSTSQTAPVPAPSVSSTWSPASRRRTAAWRASSGSSSRTKPTSAASSAARKTGSPAPVAGALT